MSIYFGNNVANVSKLITTELPYLLRYELVKKSAELVSLTRKEGKWKRKPSGICAQPLKIDTKNLNTIS
jgi:hypothetical protein